MIASVIPGVWMLTNRTLPSDVNVGPVNSDYSVESAVPMFSWLRAIAYVGPPGVELRTCEAPTPSLGEHERAPGSNGHVVGAVEDDAVVPRGGSVVGRRLVRGVGDERDRLIDVGYASRGAPNRRPS